MGFLDGFRRRGAEGKTRRLVEDLAGWVLQSLRDDVGVRVEDAVSGSATIVGERCIDLAGEYPLRDHEFVPGSRVFSDRVNEILCGCGAKDGWDALPGDSVFGLLRDGLDGQAYPPHLFPPLTELIAGYASRIGEESDWGRVPLSVPEDHHPLVLPLEFGFVSRDRVDRILRKLNGDKRACLTIATSTLVEILNSVAEAIDPAIALTLALETANGMAKTAPLTRAALESVEGLDDVE